MSGPTTSGIGLVGRHGRQIAIALTILVSAPALSSSSYSQEPNQQIIEARILGFRDIGSSFKNIGDQLKSGEPNLDKIESSAKVIRGYAGHVQEWFPQGSEPPPKAEQGWIEWFLSWFSSESAYAPASTADSHARPEIWSDPAAFAEAIRQFEAASESMQNAAVSRDTTRIEAEFHSLERTCKACHDKFRTELD